jgi:hypothetical protein
MSSYIPCRLVLNGPEDELDALIELLSDSKLNIPLSLSATVPIPEDATKSVDDIEAWCESYWGTQHILFGENPSWLRLKDGSRYLNFYSRGLPPFAWLAFTADNYANIRFSLYSMNLDEPMYDISYPDAEWDSFTLEFLQTVMDKFENVDLSDSDAVVDVLFSFEGKLAVFADMLITHYSDLAINRYANADAGYAELVKFIEGADESYRSFVRTEEMLRLKDEAANAPVNVSALGKVKKLFKR